MEIKDLNPKEVWRFFSEISEIPRCSGDEQRVSDYLVNFAKQRDLEVSQDEALNVLIKKPASEACKDLPTVALQAHMDMVCVKDKNSNHNFDTDPIELVVDGEWVRANGTTLGADNGMGVAYILAVLDDESIEHGPIEALITTGEETAMVGANALDGSEITAKYLLNIDSEEDGILTIGCAGGLDLEVYFDASLSEAKADEVIRVNMHGFEGGHSGMEIDKAKLNTLKAMGRLLNGLEGLRFADIHGGVKRNAIAAEAVATFTTANLEKDLEAIKDRASEILNESRDTDPNGAIDVEIIKSETNNFMSSEASEQIVNVLFTLPDGLYKKHEGEIITSSNLGTLEKDGDQLILSSMIRSQIDSAKLNRAAIAAKIAEVFGATTNIKGSYSGWQREETKLVDIFNEVWNEQNGGEMEVGTTHGGLECGIFKGVMPNVEMISFGPEIHGAHSPAECANIKSVERNYKLLVEVLKRIK